MFDLDIKDLVKGTIDRLEENMINIFGEDYYKENLESFIKEETSQFFAKEFLQERGITIVSGSDNLKSHIWGEENKELENIKNMIGSTYKDVKLMITTKEDLNLIKQLIKLVIQYPHFSLISMEDAMKTNYRFIDEHIMIDEKLKVMDKVFEIKNREDWAMPKDMLLKKQKYSSTKEKLEQMRKYRK